MNVTLVLNHISKKYGNDYAVNKVSMQLEPGIYGLIGANGAGKSTLMNLMCGLIEPSEGIIQYNGESIKKLQADYYKDLGYLPQNFGIYPNFTAEEFLIYTATLKGVSHAEQEKRIDATLEAVGLYEVKKKKTKTFSGGMRQRLGIAQAIIGQPKVLILDEPTVGLDPGEKAKFQALLASMATDRIIILSTHVLQDVECISKECILLNKGNICAKGTIPELLNSLTNKVRRSEDITSIERNDADHIRNFSDASLAQGEDRVKPTMNYLYKYYCANETAEGKKI